MSKNNKSANTYGLDEEALQTLGECDVVCHQNRRCHKWIGNVKYQHIINTHREAYLNETRKENKSKLTRSIMQQVKDMGGRFVKYDSEAKAWKEIGAEAQHDKVSHALRATNQARRKRKHANKGAGSDDEASRVSPVPPSSPLPASPIPPTARFSPVPAAARSPLPQSLPPQIQLPFPLAQQSVLSDQPPLKKIRLQEPVGEAISQTTVDHAVPLKKRAQSNGLMTPLDINRMMSTGGMAEFARLWESMSQPGNGPLNQPVAQGPIAQAVSYTEPEDLAPLDMLRTRTASIGVWAAVADALAAEQKQQQQQQEPKRESESDKDTQDTASQATPISDLKPLERLRTISANVWATLAQEAGLAGLGFSDDNEKKEAPQDDEKEAATDPTSADDDEKKQATQNGETQASLAGTGTTGAAGAGLQPLERLRTISESVWATLAQEAGLDFVTRNDDNENKKDTKNGTLEPLDMLRLRTISMAALGPPSRAAVAATAAAMAEPSMAPPPSRPGANASRNHSDEAATIAPKSDFVQSWLKMSSPSSSSNNDALSNNNTSTKQS